MRTDSTLARRSVLLTATAILGVGLAQCVSAEEAPCSAKLAELGRLFDGQLSAYRLQGRIGLAHVSISCPRRGSRPTIHLSYPSEYPPESFYDEIGRISAGAAGHRADLMELRAHRCHRAAKRTLNGHAQKTFGTLRIACDRGVSHSSFTIRY